MIEKLLEARGRVNERGVNGETPLMFAARSGNLEALNSAPEAMAPRSMRRKPCAALPR